MKCKQCGWDNPENRERCEKCGNLLSRQRPDETYMFAAENERTVINHDVGAEYGVVPDNMTSPYGNVPYNNPPYGNTPYSHHPYGIDMPAPQQSSSASYRHSVYGYQPQAQQYAAELLRPKPVPQVHEEQYCPECDAELPTGATECPACHTVIRNETIEIIEGVCPDCGTEVAPNQKFCHDCGARLKEPAVAMAPQPVPHLGNEESGGITIEKPGDAASTDAGMSDHCPHPSGEAEDTISAGPLCVEVPECKLQMLAPDGSELLDHTVVCAGDEVDLYRSNTDPANNTIARDLQARLSFADGKWSIEDCSSLRTTYVRPGRKLELRDGDVIVMGNREFIFKL